MGDPYAPLHHSPTRTRSAPPFSLPLWTFLPSRTRNKSLRTVLVFRPPYRLLFLQLPILPGCGKSR